MLVYIIFGFGLFLLFLSFHFEENGEKSKSRISGLSAFFVMFLALWYKNGMEWFYDKMYILWCGLGIMFFVGVLFICMIIGFIMDYKEIFIISYILDKIWKDKE